MNYGGRIQWDGSFAVANVPPGRYMLRARGDDSEEPLFATQPLTVTGGDTSGVTVILSPGATISGTVTFASAAEEKPDYTRLRIAAPSTEPSVAGPVQSRVEKDGHFAIHGLAAGPHLIRPGNQIQGWVMKSATIDGRDVTDSAIELDSGQQLENVVVTFTDTLTEINGAVANDRGVPVTEYTVLAFSTDPAFWRPQSRHIMTARPDQTGRFRIRGLPPGEYYLVTVDPAEQGEWFEAAYLDEHRTAAVRIALGEGETKTRDFTVKN
jgi:hypothetical protein